MSQESRSPANLSLEDVHDTGPHAVEMHAHGLARFTGVAGDHGVQNGQVLGAAGLDSPGNGLDFEKLGEPPKIGDDRGHDDIAATLRDRAVQISVDLLVQIVGRILVVAQRPNLGAKPFEYPFL